MRSTAGFYEYMFSKAKHTRIVYGCIQPWQARFLCLLFVLVRLGQAMSLETFCEKQILCT